MLETKTIPVELTTCDVEMINMNDIHTVYERMQRSDVKYRFVIDMATL